MGTHPCLRCRQFLERASNDAGELGKCEAFPNGIPYEVYAYMHHDSQPTECNNGIGFEPIEQTEKPSE